MGFEKRLDELGSVIQKAEAIFELSQKKFLQEYSVLPNEIAVVLLPSAWEQSPLAIEQHPSA